MTKDIVALTSEKIVNRIFLIRGKKVIFDKDLAELYGVETKVLNQAVKRNIKRFPKDFMFQLSKKESVIWSEVNLRSQIVTSSSVHGGQRYLPFAFTEQGIAMLSSVLKSETAIEVNIQIIRTFTKLREMLSSNSELRNKIEEIEKNFNSKFEIVFRAIKELLSEPKKEQENKVRIGFN